jgi:hypothetical protein
LSVDRRRHGIDRRGEGGADRLENVAMIGGDRGAQQIIMTRQSGAHRLGIALPEFGRAFEIGEQERGHPVAPSGRSGQGEISMA